MDYPVFPNLTGTERDLTRLDDVGWAAGTISAAIPNGSPLRT